MSAGTRVPAAPHRHRSLALLLVAALAPAGAALAQSAPAAATGATAGTDAALRRCTALSSDNQARLACFDAWAAEQAQAAPAGGQAWQAPAASANAMIASISEVWPRICEIITAPAPGSLAAKSTMSMR